MRWRPFTWLLISIMFFVAAIYFWRLGDEWAANRKQANPGESSKSAPQTEVTPRPAKQSKVEAIPRSERPGNLNRISDNPPPKPDPSARYPHRLSNTSKTVGQLARSDKAILLENAILDTGASLDLQIPESLRAKGDPGSYIVQSRSALDAAFRARLQSLGAGIVSYIPNNSYLVRASAAMAHLLESDPGVQVVLPYEPYYKLKPGLLALAVTQQPLPENSALNVVLFSEARDETLSALQGQGVEILGEVRSPFGPVLQVRPPADGLTAVAGLPGVQAVELLRKRVPANDLSRVTIGVSPDTTNSANYLGLSGTNVIVNVNDTGVDQFHPDLTGRVFSDTDFGLTDTDGHGTHVAGIIAGTGSQSTSVFFASGSVSPGQPGQFRGKAPAATIFSMAANLTFGPLGSDAYLQETAWQKRALISNNSWHYFDDNDYDLAAASYDAAVRDALPGLPGSQPLLFVFAAGNNGAGADDGASGFPDTIQSPATAKNVLTVGAIEQIRNITNEVTKCTTILGVQTCETNTIWMPKTDAGDQVADFSSRGNVGIGIEGDWGRFKPDVVAPGVFVVSTRSTTWDTAAYYNPTSHMYQDFTGLIAQTNQLWVNSIFVQDNAVAVNIDVLPNAGSPIPFPDLPIYVKQSDSPTPTDADFVRTNHVSIPPDGPPPLLNNRGVDWFYGVGNDTGQPVPFDLHTDLTVTNAQGNYFEVLSNMNEALGPFYRYESGTSMAAGEASGMLALMQDFFQRQSITNSPALMKALVINGARSVGILYNLQVQKLVNDQGWGLINLPNSIPAGITNLNPITPPQNAPMYLFDQSPTNALATGQSQTRYFALSPAAQSQALRATLVWTDPPGNPVASIKLVNDLDLIVTNLDTGDVFFGNDILAGNDSNVAWDTNSPPNLDVINNVENVFLSAALGSPLSTNYSVTVVGRRVNVNAVTGHTNDVVQDYALVVSSGEGLVVDALSLTNDLPITSAYTPLVTHITNTFTLQVADIQNHDIGGMLLSQHAGANSPLLGLEYVPIGAGRLTIGITNQWHFYVITNENPNGSFTNAAFLTFLAPDLATPRMGVRADDPNEATPVESDLELYVSTDFNLTNLSPAVLTNANTSKSVGRGATQQIVLTNATSGLYYIAIKAEFQEAAEYGFLGDFSDLPFNSTDQAGNQTLRGFPVPVVLQDGTAQKPAGTFLFAIATDPSTVRRVIVTNGISHELMGDLQGTLVHNRRSVVLNNHSPQSRVDNVVYVYDDSDQQDVPPFKGDSRFPARHTDGPGSLQTFGGQPGIGQWMLSMVDNSPQHLGTNRSFTVFLERQPDLSNGVSATILPGACRDDFVYVPVEGTNLTVTVGIESGSQGAGPLLLTVCPEGASGSDCKSTLITNNVGTITFNKYTLPPLNAGLYVIRVCNLGVGPVKVRIVARVTVDINGVVPIQSGSAPTFIQDDAVVYSSQFIASTQKIASVDVGVRIDHPRVSDLALTLISPSSKRILLFENRGGTTTAGMGSGALVTNVFPTFNAGDANAQTNILDVGVNQGLLIINYDFFPIPDFMHIYYDGKLIYDTGLISGPGQFSLNFGPGISTNLMIVMNEGDNPDKDTKWTYTALVVNAAGFSYLTFTENTNLTTTPIKFAIPPFGSASVPTTVPISDFEVNPGEYFPPALVDQWQLASNQVTVLRDPVVKPPLGNNALALAGGTISRTLPTTSGSSYSLSFAYRGPDIVGFWRGENNANDSLGLNNGVLLNNAGFGPGEVGTNGAAFLLDGISQHVRIPDATNLQVTSSLTLEAWVRPTRFGAANAILSKFDKPAPSFNQKAYLLACTSSGQLSLTVSPDGAQVTTVTSPGTLTLNAWSHVAGTYDGATLKVYINGTLVNQTPYSSGIYPGTNDLSIGATAGGYPTNQVDSPWAGSIDEASVYRRALTASEIKAIFVAGTAGKFDPFVRIPEALSEARVILPGVSTNMIFGNNYSWQNRPINFKATQNGTPLRIEGVEPGLLLDDFKLTGVTTGGGNYYLPEESLSALVGDIAFGTWQLEILDTRVGATNSLPLLEAWQLSFVFATPTPKVIELTTGYPSTNTIPAGGIIYFSVDVPTWAYYATNILLFADGPVNLLFNQFFPPLPTDLQMLTGVTKGVGKPNPMSTNSSPPLVQDATYYLGVQNTTSSEITAAVEVDFNITPLFDRVPITNQTATLLPRYFYFDVSSNATAVSFQLYNLSGNLDLLARSNLPPASSTADADYSSTNPGTNDETIIVFTNSVPVPLSAGRWYLSVIDADQGTNKFSIVAKEYTNPIPVITRLFNKVPYTNSNAGGTNNLDYYVYTVSPSAGGVKFELDNPTADVTLIGRKGLPLPTPGDFDFQSANPGTADESVVLFKNTSPPVSPGDWFLTVVNVSAGQASYTIMASEIPPPVVNTNLIITNWFYTSNSFCLTWVSVPGTEYFVQGKTDIASPWDIIPPPVTATNTFTTFCVPLPSQYHFFQILQGAAPPPIVSLTNGVPATTTIAPGQIAYFFVDVPSWANFATNILNSADGPINLLFNQTKPPVTTDVKLLTQATSGIGSPVLSSNSVPQLVRGSSYYLGVENTTAASITAAIEVDFDITPLSSGVPIAGQMSTNSQSRYFYYDVSTNGTSVSFQLLNLSGDLNLVARKGLPLPTAGSADYGSFNPGTNDESIIIFTNSSPIPLSSGRWYLGVLNADLGSNSFRILATEYTTPVPVIYTLVNAVPFANTNTGGANNTDYYRYNVSPNAQSVTFEVDNPTANVTLVGRKGIPLPSLASFDFLSANPGTSNEVVVLNAGSTPPVTPGDWFLAVVNISGGNAAYSIMATEQVPVVNTNLVITNWFLSSNSLCFSWTSVAGAEYVVQGTTNLGGAWVNISTNPATPPLNTECIPLPSPYHFFRVIQGTGTNPNPGVTIGSITRTTNGVLIQWTAPASAVFKVQWKATLNPTNWIDFTGPPVTSTDGNFSFLDDGSQTGGLAGPIFYRLVQISQSSALAVRPPERLGRRPSK